MGCKQQLFFLYFFLARRHHGGSTAAQTKQERRSKNDGGNREKPKTKCKNEEKITIQSIETSPVTMELTNETNNEAL